MQELSLFDIQETGKKILEYIADVCEDYDIPFYLAYGTALGAVRHHGYIPWDDDVDIYMTRECFCRFAEVMDKQDNSRYKLLYTVKDKSYAMPLPKVIDTTTIWYQNSQREDLMPLGVWVDIFVLDNVPADESERERFIKKLDHNQIGWTYLFKKKDYASRTGVAAMIKRCIWFVFRHISPRFFALRLDKLAQQYNEKATGYFGSMSFAGEEGRHQEVLPYSVIGNGVWAEFEGRQYRIPEMWDQYLTDYYGDYMTLPPEEDRDPQKKHPHTAFWRE